MSGRLHLVTAATAMLVACTVASAEEPEWWSLLKGQPGTTVSERAGPDGSSTEELRLASGVVFEKSQRNGRTDILGIDESGHGAVLCAWEIYVVVGAALELCPSVNDSFKDEWRTAIDRINDFIIANSLTPVTKHELDERMNQRFAREAARAASVDPAELRRLCLSEKLTRKISFLRRTGVDDLLSVPRPPVLNPCL